MTEEFGVQLARDRIADGQKFLTEVGRYLPHSADKAAIILGYDDGNVLELHIQRCPDHEAPEAEPKSEPARVRFARFVHDVIAGRK